MGSNVGKRRQTTLVPFNAYHPFGSSRQQGAGKAARARANFDHRHACEVTGRTGDLRREVQIKEKILAERFFGRQTMPLDDIP